MNAYKYAALVAEAQSRGFTIAKASFGSRSLADLHEGKPLTVEQDADIGALEIYRWDDEVNSTLVGRLIANN
jgi:hypothetical protein